MKSRWIELTYGKDAACWMVHMEGKGVSDALRRMDEHANWRQRASMSAGIGSELVRYIRPNTILFT